MGNRVVIIGAGLAGMSAAAVLAKAGKEVLVIEKNDKPGGRINFFQKSGFRFDMGPSWYWMPQVFEDFYGLFGYKTSDFYELSRLDPSYKVIFRDKSPLEVPAKMADLMGLFEKIESGSASKLASFLKDAEYKYTVGMDEFVWKPGHSIKEFIDPRVFKSMFKLQMLSLSLIHI